MSWRKLNWLFQEVPVVPHSSSLPEIPPAQADMDGRPATLLANKLNELFNMRLKGKEEAF